jgi:Fe-S cluster biogenesis protein NfuA
MEKFFVADSYKNMEVISEPFKNEKGRLYVRVKGACPRCGGSGHYSYNQMDGTRCYGCMGSGVSVQSVRAYTEKEYKQMQAANERARAKKEAEKEAKARDLVENAAKYKHEVALKLGFGEDEKAYLVYGDDTFAIKDRLKELGARFDPTLKWFFPKEVELPEGYKLCEMSFDELYNYNPQAKWAEFKEDAKAIVSKRIAGLKGPSTSKFYPGTEKDRIRNITAKVSNIRGFEGIYGYTTVYTFTSENYVFVWMTAKCDLNLTVGETVDLTGTIKKFDEYLGVKNTYLTRCNVKKIGE